MGPPRSTRNRERYHGGGETTPFSRSSTGFVRVNWLELLARFLSLRNGGLTGAGSDGAGALMSALGQKRTLS